ncbi:MAG: hypothetical protein ACRCUO_05890 [Cetobacterium sp.]|uniref:hypothetical protein n=1 Tax=Cetobacterium TaxID=180162 RepID=UPI001F068048|nr:MULTISPECIES: hypothetical protein [Cetobacterium]MCX3065999.1 hypothetical protein [Cetobacterium somerae]UPO96458.1 hypothetical protein MKD34_04665 [Cetobacterium somerae]
MDKKELIKKLNILSKFNLEKSLLENTATGVTIPKIRLSFVTGGGIITGDIMTLEELKEEFLAFGSNKKEHESLSEVNPLSLVLHDNDLQNSIYDSFLPLRDVSIANSEHITKLNFLALFYDEIIGVTVGKLS